MAREMACLCARRGKRKRAKPPPKKAKPKVATVFDCPFCGAKDACGVRMDFDHAVRLNPSVGVRARARAVAGRDAPPRCPKCEARS